MKKPTLIEHIGQWMIPKGMTDKQPEELKNKDFTKMHIPEQKEYFLIPLQNAKK